VYLSSVYNFELFVLDMEAVYFSIDCDTDSVSCEFQVLSAREIHVQFLLVF